MAQDPTMPPGGDRAGEFVALFARHSRRIFSYILTLVPNANEADEVYQDTSMVLWQKFDEFEPGTHFGAWACRVAHFRALSHHKKRRNDRLVFDAEFVDAINDPLQQLAQDEEASDARHRALQKCMKKLNDRQRNILRRRYSPGATVQGVAETLGTTANAISKALGRIHRALFDCIRRRLQTEGLT